VRNDLIKLQRLHLLDPLTRDLICRWRNHFWGCWSSCCSEGFGRNSGNTLSGGWKSGCYLGCCGQYGFYLWKILITELVGKIWLNFRANWNVVSKQLYQRLKLHCIIC